MLLPKDTLCTMQQFHYTRPTVVNGHADICCIPPITFPNKQKKVKPGFSNVGWQCTLQPTLGMFDPGISLNAKLGESAWTCDLFLIWALIRKSCLTWTTCFWLSSNCNAFPCAGTCNYLICSSLMSQKAGELQNLTTDLWRKWQCSTSCSLGSTWMENISV